MKQFDICLMNPPYGTTGGDDIHYRFTEKCISLCDKTICVMPFALVNKLTGKNPFWRKNLSKNIVDINELNAKQVFNGTTQDNVGIYTFISNNYIKRLPKTFIDSNHIHISYLDGHEENVQELTGDPFTIYEKGFLKYLKAQGMNTILWLGYLSHMKEYCKNKKILDKNIAKNIRIKEYSNKLPKNKIALVINQANGSLNATYINNNTTGKIIRNSKELETFLIERNTTSGYNFIILNNIIAAENCKKTLQNPLLRYILSKLQTDQSITIKNCLIYIPDINWEDPRVTTDEGLLEVCGCPKDKAMEYAEYCRKYMKEFDNKNNKK